MFGFIGFRLGRLRVGNRARGYLNILSGLELGLELGLHLALEPGLESEEGGTSY